MLKMRTAVIDNCVIYDNLQLKEKFFLFKIKLLINIVTDIFLLFHFCLYSPFVLCK